MVKAARLYAWRHGLGFVHLRHEPIIITVLMGTYPQKSICEVLKIIYGLLTNVERISRTYGCRSVLVDDMTLITPTHDFGVATAGAELAHVFHDFRTSTFDPNCDTNEMWAIIELDKFRPFVTEVRGLVTQLHGMTEHLSPPADP